MAAVPEPLEYSEPLDDPSPAADVPPAPEPPELEPLLEPLPVVPEPSLDVAWSAFVLL